MNAPAQPIPGGSGPPPGGLPFGVVLLYHQNWHTLEGMVKPLTEDGPRQYETFYHGIDVIVTGIQPDDIGEFDDLTEAMRSVEDHFGRGTDGMLWTAHVIEKMRASRVRDFKRCLEATLAEQTPDGRLVEPRT